MEGLELCLTASNTPDINTEERAAWLLKVHRQFGHPHRELMELFLKKAGTWDTGDSVCVEKIYKLCKTCKEYSPTPPRPIVSLPAASEFNKVLSLDLKEVKVKKIRYILHMIDVFTRLGVSIFIKDKKKCNFARASVKNFSF